jgi:hypothetical protein
MKLLHRRLSLSTHLTFSLSIHDYTSAVSASVRAICSVNFQNIGFHVTIWKQYLIVSYGHGERILHVAKQYRTEASN